MHVTLLSPEYGVISNPRGFKLLVEIRGPVREFRDYKCKCNDLGDNSSQGQYPVQSIERSEIELNLSIDFDRDRQSTSPLKHSANRTQSTFKRFQTPVGRSVQTRFVYWMMSYKVTNPPRDC